MEALFSTTLASYEAWLMVLCVIVFIGIYVFDGITLVQRIYSALRPAQIKKEKTITTDEIHEVVSPLLVPIEQEEVEAHEAEKARVEEQHEQERKESELLEEKALEELKVKEYEALKIQEDTANDEVEPLETENIKEKDDTKSQDQGTDTIEEDNTSEGIPAEDLSELEPLEEETLEEMIEEESPTQETTEITPPEQIEEYPIQEPITEEQEVTNESDLTKSTSQESAPEQQDEPREDEHVEPIEDAIKATESVSGDAGEEKEEKIKTEEVSIITPTEIPEETHPEPRKAHESQNAEKLYGIVSEVKTLLARGHTQDARALIIQGLALDKNHRELNLILGSIYESERQAQKAEYIYKDLALVYPEDGEILERLANILIIEKRYDLALEIYKKIISLSGETEGSLYIMAHLSHELGHNEELYAYARRYQKNWPNNPEILSLLAQAEIALGERQAAIQTLIKLKNLTPYNNEIMETITKLTMEEELAGNFGREKI